MSGEKKTGGIVHINLFDSVIVIDTETGGLDSRIHALLQVAIVASRGRELVLDVLDDGEVTARATEVNGIDLEAHRARAVSADEAAERILAFLGETQATAPWPGLIVAGHHTAFDVGFVRRLFDHAGMPSPLSTYRSLDTQTLLFQAYSRGELPAEALGLGPACDHYGVPHEARHTALGDARATRELLVKLLHPGCHEKDGLVCRDTQRLRSGAWERCNFGELGLGDVFRQSQRGAWGPAYVVQSEPVPDGALGNLGLTAGLLTAAQLVEMGVPA